MIEYLEGTRLFAGISREDTGRLLSCLNAYPVEYAHDTVIIEEGSKVRAFGILLSGRGRSYKTDLDGNILTVTLLNTGSEIGVILAASPDHPSPVSAAVERGSAVLFISYDPATRGLSVTSQQAWLKRAWCSMNGWTACSAHVRGIKSWLI